MHKSSLTVAIATALLAAGYASTPIAMPQVASLPTEATLAPTDASLDVRYVRQSDLAQAVVSSGNTPAAWQTPAELKGRTLADVTHEEDSLVAWIDAGSLASESARAEAAGIVHAGIPVLVTHQAGQPRHEASTFGVEVPGTLALYSRLPDGTTHIVSGGHLTPSQVSQPVIEGMLLRIRQARETHLSFDETSASASDDSDAPIKKFYIEPRVPSPNGSEVRMDVTIARDFTRSLDTKRITVVTRAQVKPDGIGVTDAGWPLTKNLWAPSPRINGSGRVLYIPSQYYMQTAISWPQGEQPEARAADGHVPVGSGSTKHNFSDKLTESTTWSLGVTRDVSVGLADKGISAEGKIGGSLGYQKQRTKEHSITVNVEDYSIAVDRPAVPGGNGKMIRWTYPLASQIAAKVDYFKDGNSKVSTERMTPMMRQADLESASAWVVKGDYEGVIWLTAHAGARRIAYVGSKLLPVIGPGKHFRVPDPTDCAGTTDCRNEYMATARIELNSPYLTRSPSVLLKSLAVDDGCLTQLSRTFGSPVTLSKCNSSEDNLKQQWNIDEYGRYVNRASKMCLQASDIGGAFVATCTHSTAQSWKWYADRIHSQQGLGLGRLYVTDQNEVRAGFVRSRHQALPGNTNNDLLPPWSDYPRKPIASAYVPGFTVRGEPIPPEYLAFREVDKSERWKTVVLRAGLVH